MHVNPRIIPTFLLILLPTAAASGPTSGSTTTLTNTLTTARRSNPPCVESCIASHPSQSWCDGHESGRAFEECVCRGLDGVPMIECIQSCSPEDQGVFAAGLPRVCRERIFPDAALADEDTGVESRTDGAVVLGVSGVGIGVGVLGGLAVAVALVL
ncbi:hypothetical protein BDW59DRAFT_161403 [Aspergillus cavernicola]|uniref:Extracellular membrane protein CFEM domain-containing protein n=1 Tax=Aspergillus cavernicola TaxID=176166 RepID=A0ABR4IDA3_9EURO